MTSRTVWERFRVGVGQVYGQMEGGADGETLAFRIASTNTVVGDMLIKQKRIGLGGSDLTQKPDLWLLHNHGVHEHLTVHEGEFLLAARAAIQELQTSVWANPREIIELSVSFCTYNTRLAMFAIVEVWLLIGDLGEARPYVMAKAVPFQSYPLPVVALLDVFYSGLIFYTFWTEGKQLFHAVRVGFKSFLHYWGVWNVIDWSTIVLGMVNGSLWVADCIFVGLASASDLFEDSSWALHADVMTLDPEILSSVHADLQFLRGLLLCLH